MIPDPAEVSAAIRAVAAAEILPRFGKLAEAERWEKKPGSWVTVADTAAEAALITALSRILPGSVVIGEEAAEETPALLEQLSGDRPAWLVDPVDGTANFAAGKPIFAVMAALVIGGETQAGWIYEPLNDAMNWTVAGQGAWRDDERLAIAPPASDSDMVGSLGFRLRRDKALMARFARIENLQCCGIEYARLTRGDLHFAHYRRLKPWDHAAGALLHREAGGYSARLDGTPYRPGPAIEDGGGLLLAPDAATWRHLAALIEPTVLAAR
jgi:fructose-1,6-bisphosphatase/inositol monophosphatase family enzyme